MQKCADYPVLIVIPIGQWAELITSGMIKALVTAGIKFSVTKK